MTEVNGYRVSRGVAWQLKPELDLAGSANTSVAKAFSDAGRRGAQVWKAESRLPMLVRGAARPEGRIAYTYRY